MTAFVLDIEDDAVPGSNSGLRAAKAANVCWYARWTGDHAGPCMARIISMKWDVGGK